MTALREYARDAGIPERAGDAGLRPPSAEEALDIARAALVRPAGPELVGAVWEHARWIPHAVCTALFRVATSDGRDLRLCIERRVRPVSRASNAVWTARLAELLPGLHPLAELVDGGRAWWFPADRALPGAHRLHDPLRIRRLLAPCEAFAALSIRGHRSRLTLLRYKPAQRAVLRLEIAVRDADGRRSRVSLAARALAPRKAQRVLAARARCRASAALGARLIAQEDRSGLLIEEWLDGRVCGPDDFSGAHDAGRMLAELHAEPAPGPTSTLDGAEFLDLFEIERALWTIARRMAARPALAPVAPCWIHGDVHPDQVLRRTAGSTALLDWDALRAGDPAEDLASWWADALAAGASADRVLALLLEGYASGGGEAPDRSRLRAWAARGLVQRAAASIRRLESGAVDRAARLLDLAEELTP